MGKKKPRSADQLRKRMRRPARLADARQWLAIPQGTDVIGAYERWYGVNRLCAVIELRMLGVPISEEQEAQLRNAVEQDAKLCAANRAAKKQRAKEKRAAKQRAAAEHAAERAAAKRAAKQRTATTSGFFPDLHQFESYEYLYRYAERDEWIWNNVDDEAVPDRDEASFDAGWDAVADVAPESFGGYGPRSIEHNLLEDLHVLDLTVIEKVETRIERRDEVIMNVRITLEDDPEVLARCAWSLIFAVGAYSFADADVDADAVEIDEWTVGDMLRCLSFDRGRLYFHADHVRGRCMHTTVEIDREGKITLETVDRGGAAMRWISKLQGKQAMAMAEDGEGDPSLDPLPF